MSFLVCWLALTLNIYTEAGGEGTKGMEIVADTVITRVHNEKYPNDVCKVVLQSNQFNWTKRLKSKDFNGLIRYQEKLFAERKFGDKERHAYFQAAQIAYKVMKPGYIPKYKFVHFYSGSDKPYWAKGKRAYKYGNHYFLRE